MESWVVGFDGDADIERHSGAVEAATPSQSKQQSPLHVRLVSDYICPWCYVASAPNAVSMRPSCVRLSRANGSRRQSRGRSIGAAPLGSLVFPRLYSKRSSALSALRSIKSSGTSRDESLRERSRGNNRWREPQ